MSTPFSPDQLEALSLHIDAQLRELHSTTSPYGTSRAAQDPDNLQDHTPKQWWAIAKATEEDPHAFWQRFKQAAHNDLCKEGGVLNGQWQQWGDLRKESVLKSFGALLVAMGYSGNALEMLVVALAVIVLHIGLRAICEEA